MRNISTAYLIGYFLLSLVFDSCALAQVSDELPTSLVVVISGFSSDASPEQLSNQSPRGQGNSGMYQLAGDLAKAGLEARYFNWNGTSAGQFTQKDAPGTDGIASFIRERSSKTTLKRLVLIGHSWGAHTMMEIAERLSADPRIDITLAIAIDPSSFSRGERPKELPSTIQSFVNYHTHNAFTWEVWTDSERIQNVDLGDPSNGFSANNGGNYAASFDILAHNAAEWDQRIHQDVVKRTKAMAGLLESDVPSVNDK